MWVMQSSSLFTLCEAQGHPSGRLALLEVRN